jgi:cold shock CspA family protein
MTETGTVKFYDDRRYGFIVPDAGGRELFFSERGLHDIRITPLKGMRVSYHTVLDNTGRSVAVGVKVEPGAKAVRSA